MNETNAISRRTVLRGIGCAMALPWLEAMGPVTNWSHGAPTARPAPNRMAFVYVPNGMTMADWTPRTDGPFDKLRTGTDFDLPAILKPLAEVRNDLLVLTGLVADMARAHGDGNSGNHARAMAAYLTGAHPHKTRGEDIYGGTSVDQVAAARLLGQTRLASLEIGCEAGTPAGNCDTGYSCVYTSTMSWRTPTTPLPKETNPRLVFERLFAAGSSKERAARDAEQKSLLDFIRDDARDLTSKLGAADRRKIDEYFTAVREVELQIERGQTKQASNVPQGFTPPAGIPAQYTDHLRIMCDLLVLAFQADITRVSTLVFANEFSNRPYPFIGVPDGHHDLSHHGGNEAKKGMIREINIFHATQLAYLLKRLRSVPEGDATLLDHCMIAYGCGVSDGNTHTHENLPILLAGGGCGTLKPGRHLRFPAETPLTNLWVSMLDRVKAGVDILGDSTGRLAGLNG